MRFLRRKQQNSPVCFLHIGKTGGTTMLGAFDRMLPHAEICPIRHMEEIEACSYEDLKRYRLFRGHFWYSVERYLPKNTRYFTVLRNPVDRAISTYDHIRKNPHGRHHIVKELSLEEYVDAPNEVSLEIDNWQTRVLTSCIEPDQVPSIDLALSRLESFPVVGITEKLTITISLVSLVFGWAQVSDFQTLNVTSDKTDRSTISDGLFAKIRRKNELDMMLYENALQLFNRLQTTYL